MANAPAWARTLVDEVMTEANLDPASLELTWRRCPKERGTSGRCTPGGVRIVISAGTERRDCRLTVLHELAHVIRERETGYRSTVGHDYRFWVIAWGLFNRHGVPTRYALERSGEYMVTALVVAADLGIRGARTRLVRQRRDNYLRSRRRRTPIRRWLEAHPDGITVTNTPEGYPPITTRIRLVEGPAGGSRSRSKPALMGRPRGWSGDRPGPSGSAGNRPPPPC